MIVFCHSDQDCYVLDPVLVEAVQMAHHVALTLLLVAIILLNLYPLP